MYSVHLKCDKCVNKDGQSTSKEVPCGFGNTVVEAHTAALRQGDALGWMKKQMAVPGTWGADHFYGWICPNCQKGKR